MMHIEKCYQIKQSGNQKEKKAHGGDKTHGEKFQKKFVPGKSL
jgi:hypothetical protein